MTKIIIENRSEQLSDVAALELVSRVIEGGRMSNDFKEYCYLTVFRGKHCVSTNLNKKSDRFVVWDK